MAPDVNLRVSTNRPQDYVLVDLTGFVWMLHEDGQWVQATEPEMRTAQRVLAEHLAPSDVEQPPR